MIKDIKYNGFTASPSDYDCPDGDMACAMGLIPDDDALMPVLPPAEVLGLVSGQTVVGIHATATFKHYLVVDVNNRLYWRTKEDDTLILIEDFADNEISQIECIGNTILVLCKDGINYILWQSGSEAYVYLGNKMPECPISFGLQGTPKISASVDISYDTLSDTMTTPFREFSDDNKSKITSQVLAQVNSFISENSVNAGAFIYPFFVRYAYRLYDGTLSHHSAPILMLPSTWVNPIVPVVGTIGSTSAKIRVFAVAAKLDYQALISETMLAELGKWGDVIKSVDIFISAPIYTYNQSGEIECFNMGVLNGDFYGKYNLETNYKIQTIKSLYESFSGTEAVYSIQLPRKSVEDINKDIVDCGQFYFLESIEIKKLSRSRTLLNISNKYLQSLVNRELMSDDYQTHDTLIPSTMFVYNQRINIANVERLMFRGYDTASMVSYINYTDSVTTTEAMPIYTSLNTSDGSYMVKNNSSLALAQDPRVFAFLFYPDTSATQMMVRPSGLDGEKEINGVTAFYSPFKNAPLKPHAFLNGAIYFEGFTNAGWSSPFTGYSLQDDTPIVSMPNKIYTSEINNPFYFPAKGINTVGVGEVLGLSTAAKALSEGQFGQYPLYAFTSEGVWALEVSNTGGFSARQPITRDVCLGLHSITQLDNSVLFLTERGVMELSGSNSRCISDILDGKKQFSITVLPHHEQLIDKSDIVDVSFEPVLFKEYILNARMIYDYVHQHVILFNAEYSYAYVYSIESRSWGMCASNITDSVPSYPNALAMTSNNKLVDFTHSNVSEGLKGVLVSRPIKLDSNDLKTIDTVIQRGLFRKGSVKSVLYGSRDLFDWHLISSSQDHYLRGFSGTAYKFFRVVLLCDLTEEESISGCTIRYTPKQTNQPR